MIATDITTYNGRHCQVLIACGACGGTHGHEGRLEIASRGGEVKIDGRRFAIGEIRALVASPVSRSDDGGSRLTANGLSLLAQIGLVLAALAAVLALTPR